MIFVVLIRDPEAIWKHRKRDQDTSIFSLKMLFWFWLRNDGKIIGYHKILIFTIILSGTVYFFLIICLLWSVGYLWTVSRVCISISGNLFQFAWEYYNFSCNCFIFILPKNALFLANLIHYQLFFCVICFYH